MITNVESALGRVRRERYQHNMPVTFDTQDLDFYLTTNRPEPGLGDSEPYNGQEIVPSVVPEHPKQVIEYEKASSTDALATEVRSLKSQRRELKTRYAADLKRYWATLLSTKTIMKVFYKKVPTQVWLPARHLKVRAGTRAVKHKVYLKERKVVRRIPERWYSTSTRKLQRRWRVVIKTIRPYVWREQVKTRYEYVLIRPAGFYARNVRIRTSVRVKDWQTIRRLYAEFKRTLRHGLESQLKSISNRLEELSKATVRRPPRLMYSCTTHGFTRPYQLGENPEREYSVALPTYRRCFSMGPEQEPVHGAGVFPCVCMESLGDGYLSLSGAGEVEPAWIQQWVQRQEREHTVDTSGVLRVPRFPRGQDSLRWVDNRSIESSAMLAFSTVQSLTKAKDYQFQWFRSLVELKDSKQTIRTLKELSLKGSGFIAWIAGCPRAAASEQQSISRVIKRMGLKFSGTLKVLAASYLAYKFAIEPTANDVATVIDHSSDWLFEIRRALASILSDPSSRLNTYHARAKYGDGSRELKLGRYVDLASTDRTVWLEVPCSIQYPVALYAPHHAACRLNWSGNQCMTAFLSEENQFLASGTLVPSNSPVLTVISDAGIAERPVPCKALNFNTTVGYRGVKYWTSDIMSQSVFDIRRDDLEQYIARSVFGESPLVERIPVYGSTHDSGVVFAEYNITDLLDLLNRSGTPTAGTVDLMTRICDGAAELFTRLDLVKTVWELTPLSFVYDWFTDSSVLVTTLANAARSNWAVYNQVPVPRHGIWDCRRSELLTGTPLYHLAGCEVKEYTASWIQALPLGEWSLHWNHAPQLTRRVYRLRLDALDDKVHLSRSGLYRVRRGEQTGYDSIVSYLPKVSVSINGGKILSLSAMLSSLLGG